MTRGTLGDRVDLDFTLRRFFGKQTFRPLQREVIEATLNGQDVYLQAATSFGKSLCFQLPAIINHGITIVISPLLALMNNQIAGLQASNIPVDTINSLTPQTTRNAIMEDLRSGHPQIRLLYVTPEYCKRNDFQRCLRVVHAQRELARIAIDEAHCISEWGHDFRPAFKELGFFKREFADVPIICCTATATARVKEDIIRTLGLDRTKLRAFAMSTSRPNLHFEIRYKNDDEDIFDNFLRWLRAIYTRRGDDPKRSKELADCKERVGNVSGIIYALRRNDTEAIAAQLQQHGVGAKPYHAGLTVEQKKDHLEGWVADRKGYDIIVATTAFGMGIDKDNVRFVVHWQLPKSFEGFYQEAGRAGRDGKAAACILYYSREDRDRALFLQSKEIQQARGRSSMANTQGAKTLEHRVSSLKALEKYGESVSQCRHKLIAQYFGDISGNNCVFACDFCKYGRSVLEGRREKGLVSEEMCATQRETGAYGEYDDYD